MTTWEIYVPAVAAIVGALIAMLGSAMQHWLSRRSRRRDLIRENLVELYLVSLEVERYAEHSVRSLVQAVHGYKPSDSDHSGQDFPAFRLVLLARVYAPQLKEKAENMKNLADSVEAAVKAELDRLLKQQKPQIQPQGFLKRFQPLTDLQSAGPELRDKIVSLARTYR